MKKVLGMADYAKLVMGVQLDEHEEHLLHTQENMFNRGSKVLVFGESSRLIYIVSEWQEYLAEHKQVEIIPNRMIGVI